MTGTILISGANRGIGLALARRYAAEGWRVLACCRNPEEAEKLQKMSAESSGGLTVHALDVANEQGIRSLAEELKGETIDILFNNAGINGGDRQSFGGVDTEAWLQTFRVNTIAPLKMAEAFVEHVARSRRGVIAIMGSVMGSMEENTSGGQYIYRSSKSAVHMVGRSLALDLRSRGIITVLLHPGWVATDMGGASAPVSPDESAAGLQRVLEKLGPEDNGRFFDFAGKVRPW
ncbi:MAG: SDR family oxidoreductase [Syntrophotaleaceae bacterium]